MNTASLRRPCRTEKVRALGVLGLSEGCLAALAVHVDVVLAKDIIAAES